MGGNCLIPAAAAPEGREGSRVPEEGTGVGVKVKGTRGLGSHPQSPPSRTEMRVAGGTNTGSLPHPS